MPSVPARSGIMPSQAAAALRLLPGHQDGRSEAIQPQPQPLPFDADLSRTLAALGGTEARKRIHAIHPSRPGDEGAATGFAFMVLSALANCTSARQIVLPRPVLWVQDRSARFESGLPYGLGFPAFGYDPSHIVLVSTKGALEALAAVEIGLEIGGLAGVLAELPPSLPADMLALGKRLALRAERSATPCLLLHASRHAVAAPVATRWEITSLPAVCGQAWDTPLPVAGLKLVKNRFGLTGHWSAPLVAAARVKASITEETAVQGASDVYFACPSPPLPQSVAADTANRSRTAAGQERERAA